MHFAIARVYTDSFWSPQETVGAYPSAFVCMQTLYPLSSFLLPVACRKNWKSVNGNWDIDSVDCLICPDCQCHPLHGYGRFVVLMAILSRAIHRSRVSFSRNGTNRIYIIYQTRRAVCGDVQCYSFLLSSYVKVSSYVLQKGTYTLTSSPTSFLFYFFLSFMPFLQ